MKIYLPKRAKGDGVGGGWVFSRNFQKGLNGRAEFTNIWNDCDIYFISGPTLADRDEVKRAKDRGKKIVLRLDNVPRNSRNRGTGTPRMYDFAQWADEVIYQSEWARDFLKPFTGREGVVIINGTDDEIFNEDGPSIESDGEPQYIYSQYSSDNVKMWEKAWYDFQKIYFENPKAHLWIVGRPEFMGINQIEYNFDLFGGAEDRVNYLGLVENRREMAKVYRGADYLIYPSILDACSNVVVEGRMCGLDVVYTSTDEKTSTQEIIETDKSELTLKSMCNKYLNVFNKVL